MRPMTARRPGVAVTTTAAAAAAAAFGSAGILPPPPSRTTAAAATRMLCGCTASTPALAMAMTTATTTTTTAKPQQQQQFYSSFLSATAAPPRRGRDPPRRGWNAVATTTAAATTRCFGTKRGVPGNPPGDIYIENNLAEDTVGTVRIDSERIRGTASKVRDILGYDTYDVSVLFVDDDEMRETNLESRGIDRPTDILSFPFHDAVRPGLLHEPDFDIPDYYTLGDIMIDVPYVLRRIEEDRMENHDPNNNNNNNNSSSSEEEMIRNLEDLDTKGNNKNDDAEEEDEEDSYYGYGDDRGVSGAMSRIYDLDTRIRMLLVHGMLHLVGHDHETDEEYEIMVTEEERILRELDLYDDPRE